MELRLSELVDKVQEIVLNPKNFWKAQKEKEEGLPILLGSYFFPILLIVVLVIFLSELFRSADYYVVFALLKAVREFILFTTAFFVLVYFTNILIKTFGGEKDIKAVRQLVAYSLTPVLLVSMVVGLFPFLYPLDILGVYGFYIFWTGGKELLHLPEQKRDSYLVLTIVVDLFIFGFLGIILSQLLTAYF